jgi:GT2 family glycosyltransferase
VSVALGITTYNRPFFLEESLPRFLSLPASWVFIVDDGSDEEYRDHYDQILSIDNPRVTVIHRDVNGGVATAKNDILRAMLATDAQWFFLAEDDVLIDSPQAITGYIHAAEQSGYEHLMFHAHGETNPFPIREQGPVTLWPNYVAAYCLYSRRAIEIGGLFDETFYNAFEHLEHSTRLARLGFTPNYPADARGSENWIHEIPGSLKQSSIVHDKKWVERFVQSRDYIIAKYPELYSLIWHV